MDARAGAGARDRAASRCARSYTDDVEWSAEDGSRTEHDFLCRCVEAAIKAGATTSTSPTRSAMRCRRSMRAILSRMCATRAGHRQGVFSAHCHNDLGLAVANSLAAIRRGARQVECTINGIGERAGNAALEEIVMALRTRARRAAATNRHQHRADHAASRCCRRSPALRCSPTRRSSGATPSPMRAASTRTAC